MRMGDFGMEGPQISMKGGLGIICIWPGRLHEYNTGKRRCRSRLGVFNRNAASREPTHLSMDNGELISTVNDTS